MEVGGLGFFNTVAASGKQPAKGQEIMTGKFMDMMASVLSGAMETSTEVMEQTGEPVEEVAELLEFLETLDLLELESGMAMLDDLMVNGSENLLEKALSQFGLSGEGLDALLQKWASHNGMHHQLEADSGEMTEDQLIASLAAVLTAMADSPAKDLASKLDKNDLQAIKALKLYDLMSKYSDSYVVKNNSQLKEIMQKLGSKLGTLLEQTNRTGKSEYLQPRFTRLAAELNMANQKNMIISEGLPEGSNIKAEVTAGTITFMPQMTKAEQLTLILNSTGRPVSAEELMKQFETILSKSQFMNSGGTQRLFIKLYPEHLGSIRVELFQKDQTMMARIITTTGAAKETLESQLNGLRQAFVAQNLTIERIEITQQAPQQDRFLNRDPQQQQRQPDRNEQENKEEKKEFNISFEEALLNMEA